MAEKPEIETYWYPGAAVDGQVGCWVARLVSNHGIHAAGVDEGAAVRKLLVLLKTFDMSEKRSDYTVKRSEDSVFKPGDKQPTIHSAKSLGVIPGDDQKI